MSEDKNEAEVIADLAVASATPQYIDGTPFMVVNNGQQVQAIDRMMEAPPRHKNDVTCARLETFIDLVNDRKEDNTQLFARLKSSRQDGSISAVINGRTRDQKSWQDDQVSYTFETHNKMDMWRRGIGSWMSCREFAMFLEQHRSDVHQRKDSNDPSAADVIDMARSIRGSAKVEFSEDIDETTGARGATYAETIKLKSGKSGELEIPGHFTIAIPLFEGDIDKVALVCILRAQVSEDGKVCFSYRIDDLDEIIDMAVQKAVAETAEKVGIKTVYYIK